MLEYLWNELCEFCVNDPNEIRKALDKMYEYLENTNWED